MNTAEALNSCRLFSGLSEEQLQWIMPLCRPQAVEGVTHIFREGESARFLYVVEKGRVALEMTGKRPEGGLTQPAPVATIRPWETFGWSAIVEPHILTLSAKAVGPCDLILLEGNELREVLDQYRDVGFLVLEGVARLLADRLVQTRETLIYERG